MSAEDQKSGRGIDFQAPDSTAPETETIKPKQIWIIDDNAEHIGAVLRSFRDKTNAELRYFQEGEKAIVEFEKLAADKQESPTIILMDYKLDDYVDSPKYHTGVEVMTRIREIAQENGSPVPDFVAFSSESNYAQELLSAGASSSVKKSDMGEIRNFFGTI